MLPSIKQGGGPRSRRLKNHTEGAPGPQVRGTGETVDPNWQEEAGGLAGSVPAPQGFVIAKHTCATAMDR
jgi:hypothetical protein